MKPTLGRRRPRRALAGARRAGALSRRLIAEVLGRHTYHHRMGGLLAALGFPAYQLAAARACAD